MGIRLYQALLSRTDRLSYHEQTERAIGQIYVSITTNDSHMVNYQIQQVFLYIGIINLCLLNYSFQDIYFREFKEKRSEHIA